jgi:hypothetical protein
MRPTRASGKSCRWWSVICTIWRGEVRLTEAEFHQACAVVAKLGQLSKFGVTHALVGRYLLHETGAAPATDIDGPWHSLDHHVVIEPGEARLPAPPITGKAAG